MKIVVLEADAVIPKREAWSRMCDLGEVVLYPQTTVAEVVDRLADADIAILIHISSHDYVFKNTRDSHLRGNDGFVLLFSLSA